MGWRAFFQARRLMACFNQIAEDCRLRWPSVAFWATAPCSGFGVFDDRNTLGGRATQNPPRSMWPTRVARFTILPEPDAPRVNVAEPRAAWHEAITVAKVGALTAGRARWTRSPTCSARWRGSGVGW